jgi:hypothetical protein
VANIGARDGVEIAQVYVGLPKTSGEHFRRLAAWQRVELKTREQRTVTAPLEALAIATFDESKDAWTWPSGEYSIAVGGSSRESAPADGSRALLKFRIHFARLVGEADGAIFQAFCESRGRVFLLRFLNDCTRSVAGHDPAG